MYHIVTFNLVVKRKTSLSYLQQNLYFDLLSVHLATGMKARKSMQMITLTHLVHKFNFKLKNCSQKRQINHTRIGQK